MLIPKVKDPHNPSQFWPVSLCNVFFKLVTKTIANILKPILPSLIHNTQITFVTNRQITDNALVAFEIFHCMKKKTKGKQDFSALKLDMSKAYDRVEWLFCGKDHG